MNTQANQTTPRERILKTAAELFFYQGYRATGINEVIKKSGVAKATFYSHFASKDELCLAYLRDRNTSEYESITAAVNDHKNPKDRFIAVIASLEPWLEANSMRGCCFLNMVAEIPDPDHRLRQLGDNHYDMVHDLILQLARELIAADHDHYGSLDAEVLANDYMLVLVGAIAMAEVYNAIWPVRNAVQTIERLIA